MFNPLDMGTVLIVGALSCLTLSGVMVYYSFARKTYPGFYHWTVGVVCIGVGSVLVAMRGFLPGFVSIVIGNSLIAALPYCLTQGMAMFLNAKWNSRIMYHIIFAFFVATLLWGVYIHPSLHLRIIALSSVMLFYFAKLMYMSIHNIPRMFGHNNWLLIATILTIMLASALRILLTMTDPGSQVFLVNDDLGQSVSVLFISLGVIAIICQLFMLNSQRMECDLKAANYKIEALANRDGLTNIYNRRYFDLKLQQEFKRMRRESQSISLIIGDIDCFKNFNDAYGHQAGDDCIKVVAEAFWKAGRRVSDVAARYGGEEFVILLPNTNLLGAKKVATEIANAVKSVKIPHKTSVAANIVTLSIGVSSLVPTTTTAPDELISMADKALYRSKQNGRNQIFFESRDIPTQKTLAPSPV